MDLRGSGPRLPMQPPNCGANVVGPAVRCSRTITYGYQRHLSCVTLSQGIPICWAFDNQELGLSKNIGIGYRRQYAMGREWTNGIDHCTPPHLFTGFHGKERASLTFKLASGMAINLVHVVFVVVSQRRHGPSATASGRSKGDL